MGVDCDGTVRNFTLQLNRLLRERGSNIPEEREVREYDEMWSGKGFYGDKKTVQEVWDEEQARLFRDAPPFEGAKEFVEKLATLGDVVFITKQQTSEAGIATFNWIEDNIGTYPVKVIEGHDKWRYCDVLIDDYPVNLNEARAHAVAGLCIARPYNEDYPAALRGDYEYTFKLCSIIKALGASQILAKYSGRA